MRESNVDPEPWIIGTAAVAILLTLAARWINTDPDD